MAVGDPNLYFSRDTKVYLVQGTNIWQIPVLNGFTFTQATNSSDVVVSEMSDSTGTSRRGRQTFNDSLAPAAWSFSTYARPYLVTGTPNRVRAVEEPLWANFVANNTYTPATPAWASGVTYAPAELDFDFSASNKTTLGVFDLIFVLGAGKSSSVNYAADGSTEIYRVSNCSINQVAITFDINGISTLAWSGMGAQVLELATFDATNALTTGIVATNNFIRNRLTQLTLTSSVSGGPKTYLVTLTGGTITLTNSLTYLTPAVLGIVNVPLGHVTGTRSIGGSFTCYLDERTNGSADLIQDLTTANTTTQNHFAMDFYVGGKAAGDAPIAPGVQFKIPNANLTIPALSTGDVISMSVNFAALPTSLNTTDEVSLVKYTGIVPA